MRPYSLVLSVEHATHAIPARYRALFEGQEDILGSHRGWDPGAAELARRLARATRAPLHRAQVSRLLVDCNRSPGNPTHFSEFTRGLDAAERERIVTRYYWPFRRAFQAEIEARVARQETVLHLSVHSFTPVLNGRTRRAEIGLLYDPSRARERDFCSEWQRALLNSGYIVRRNYPYRGVGDAHVTRLRQHYRANRYLGIELEVNQRLVQDSDGAWRNVMKHIEGSLMTVLRSGRSP